MSAMIRTKQLLHRQRAADDGAVFTGPGRAGEDYPDGPPTRLVVDARTYRDLGEPAEITVTIEPGYTVNVV